MPLPLGVFYLYHLDFDADTDAAARCGYSLKGMECQWENDVCFYYYLWKIQVSTLH